MSEDKGNPMDWKLWFSERTVSTSLSFSQSLSMQFQTYCLYFLSSADARARPILLPHLKIDCFKAEKLRASPKLLSELKPEMSSGQKAVAKTGKKTKNRLRLVSH